MRRKTFSQSILLSFFLVLMAAGCARGPRIEPLHTERFSPRPPDYPILVTEGDYKDPYIALALVTTQPYEDRLTDVLGKAELERIARQLGGDAVIKVGRQGVFQEELERRPDTIPRLAGHMESRVALMGIVIRFVR